MNVQRSANELEKLLEALEKDMRAMKKCIPAVPHCCFVTICTAFPHCCFVTLCTGTWGNLRRLWRGCRGRTTSLERRHLL